MAQGIRRPHEAIDFAAMYGEFDAAVMGRKTYDTVKGHDHMAMMKGIACVVFSRTEPARDEPGLRVTAEDPAMVVRALKAQPGRDIWLYGGETILTADLDLGDVARGKMDFDVVGHYARPDVFQLSVNERPASAVTMRRGE